MKHRDWLTLGGALGLVALMFGALLWIYYHYDPRHVANRFSDKMCKYDNDHCDDEERVMLTYRCYKALSTYPTDRSTYEQRLADECTCIANADDAIDFVECNRE